MFGENEIHGKADDDGGSLKVVEVFPTLQGEGPYAGMPAVFVRLSHCNLKCWYCDTQFDEGEDINIARLSIECKLKSVRANLVVITGGEPLRQNIGLFVELLLSMHYRVQIETAGTLWQESLNKIEHQFGSTARLKDILVCSPKTPRINSAVELMCRHWKYIVAADDCDPRDGLPIKSTQTKGRSAPPYRARHGTIWVQPRADYNTDGTPDTESSERNVKHAVNIAMKYGYRLSLQQHKILNLP